MELETKYYGSQHNIQLYQNAQVVLELSLFDALGDPVVLTGIKSKIQIKPVGLDTPVIAEVSSDAGTIVHGTGTITATFAHTLTVTIPNGQYEWDLHLYKDDNSYSDYPLYGYVNVRRRITA